MKKHLQGLLNILFLSFLLTLLNVVSIIAQPHWKDPGFNQGQPGANGTVYAIARQDDGKFILGGDFTEYNGTPVQRVVRINVDGSLDNTFNVPSNGIVYDIKILNDGSILFAGNFTDFAGQPRICLAMVNSSGALAPMSVNFSAGAVVYSVAQRANGDVFIGGSFSMVNGTARNNFACIQIPNGVLHGSFFSGTGPNRGTNGYVKTVIVDASGFILIGGNFTQLFGTGRNYIARIDVNGNVDGFNATLNNTVLAIREDPSSPGRYLVGGDFTQKFTVLNNTGGLIFGGGGVDFGVYSLKVYSDGKVLIGGDFDTYSGTTRNRFARLKSDYSLDTDFAPGGFNNQVHAIELLPDGRIIVGGSMVQFMGQPTGRVEMVFGGEITVDPAFAGGGPYCEDNTISLQYYGYSGTFVPSNTFNVQLSDITGDFSAPQIIGTNPNSNSNAGLISCLIPNVTSGSGYRVRVVSTDNYIIGVPSDPFTIYPYPSVINASSNSPVCSGETISLSSAAFTGATYAWTGPASFSSNLQNPTIVNAAAAHGGSYTVTIGYAAPSCSNSENVIVDVYATPSAVASSNSPVCEGGTLNLGANNVAGATYDWSGPNGFSSSFQNPSIAGVTPGIQDGTYTVIITDANSCLATAQTNVVINPAPVVGTPTGPSPVCEGTTVVYSVAPVPGATGYSWLLPTGSSIITGDNTNSITVLIGSASGNVCVSVTNSCGSSPNNCLSVTVDLQPVANAGADQTVCADNTTLAANTPAPGSGAWTVFSGGGTFTDFTDPMTSVTNLIDGPNVFRWTITNGSCTASSDDVTITREAEPTTANAGPDQNVCATTATLAGNTPFIGTGVWSLISGSATIIDPNDPNTTVTGLSAGSTVFRWTISNGSCTPSFDQVTITRDLAPTPAYAGPDQNICATTTTLSANTPVTGTGEWFVISGTATVTDPVNPNSGVTGLIPGASATLRWTINNGSCTPSFDDFLITVDESPSVANAGTDQTVSASTAVLAGNTPAVGTGAWSVVSGAATVDDPMNPSSGVSGLDVGANVFRWTISNGVCPPSFDEVTITRTAAVCDAAVPKFSADLSGDPSGFWESPDVVRNALCCSYSAPDVCVEIDVTLDAGASGIIFNIASGTIPGGPNFYQNECGVQVALGSPMCLAGPGPHKIIYCKPGNNNNTYSITSLPADPGTVSGPVSVCENASGVSYSIPPVPGGAYSWTVPIGSSVASGAGTNSIEVDFGSSSGQICVNVVTVCSAGSACENITVESIPSQPVIGWFDPVCINSGSGNFWIDNIESVSYIWTVPSGASINSGQGTPNLSVEFNGNSGDICVTANNGCASSSQECITPLFRDAPLSSPVIYGPASVCEGDMEVEFIVDDDPDADAYYWVIHGIGSFGNPRSVLVDFPPGSLNQIISVSPYNSCGAAVPATELFVEVNTPPVVNAGADQTICANAGSVSLSGSVSGGTALWTTSGSGTFSDENSPVTEYNPSGADTGGSVTLTLSVVGCGSVFDEMTITFTPAPSADAGTDGITCGTVPYALNGSVTVASGGIWTSTGFGSFTPDAITLNASYVPSSDDAGTTVTLRLTTTGSGSCSPEYDEMLLQVNSGPSAVISSVAPAMICPGNFTDLRVAFTPGTGPWDIIYTDGGSNYNIAGITDNPYLWGVSPAVTTTYSLVSVQASGCSGAVSGSGTVTVISDPNVSLSVSADDDIICNAEDAVINISGSEDNFFYRAYISGSPSGAQATGSGGTIQLTIPSGSLSQGMNTVSFKVGRSGCADSDLDNSVDLYYGIVSAPAIAGGTQLCTGSSVVLSVPPDVLSYQWYLGNSLIVGETGDNYTAVTAGDYYLEASDGICSDKSPVHTVTYGGNIPVITAASDTLLSTSPASSYQWYAGQRAIIGANGQTYRPYFNAAYYVSVNSNNCRLMSAGYNQNSPAMDQLVRQNFPMTDSTIFIPEIRVREEEGVAIYPNPAQGDINLRYQCYSLNPVTISLYNSMGNMVAEKIFPVNSGIISTSFHGYNLQPGLYLVHIKEGERTVVKYVNVF